MHRIFVYGTLKNGQPNSHYMKSPVSGKCEYIGTACTEEAFPLVIGTTWNIPLLLYAPGKGQVGVCAYCSNIVLNLMYFLW